MNEAEITSQQVCSTINMTATETAHPSCRFKSPIAFFPSRLLILLVCTCFHSTLSSSINSKAPFSPIKELAPSLAASVAGGTVIAVRSRLPSNDATSDLPSNDVCKEEDDCIVILFRSPNVSRKTANADEDCARNLTITSVYGSMPIHINDNYTTNLQNQQDELSPLFRGPLNHPYLPSNNNARILHAQSGLLLAATGFQPDISHLLHIATGRILSRNSIYDTGKSLDPHKLVREDLSNVLIDAASSDGGRPMGVQCLVIGQSCIKKDTLEVYTIDPSGGWRSHVGWGAVVGRGAEKVRTSLMTLKSSMNDSNEKKRGWKLALDRAMAAAVSTFELNEDTSSIGPDENLSHLYKAIVIFCSGRNKSQQLALLVTSNSKCAAIHPLIVQDSYKRCLESCIGKKTAVLTNKE